ncbi:unnamed protein product [Symbiodinium necroappetens]|uniref:Uncharacterized protein n=1 Tax=Symbiodinium necroappetens TaxID=1628268 RepID=A0A812RIW5_9DINO|nr:unnamed protein product [Symbiodinium necroappetens]
MKVLIGLYVTEVILRVIGCPVQPFYLDGWLVTDVVVSGIAFTDEFVLEHFNSLGIFRSSRAIRMPKPRAIRPACASVLFLLAAEPEAMYGTASQLLPEVSGDGSLPHLLAIEASDSPSGTNFFDARVFASIREYPLVAQVVAETVARLGWMLAIWSCLDEFYLLQVCEVAVGASGYAELPTIEDPVLQALVESGPTYPISIEEILRGMGGSLLILNMRLIYWGPGIVWKLLLAESLRWNVAGSIILAYAALCLCWLWPMVLGTFISALREGNAKHQQKKTAEARADSAMSAAELIDLFEVIFREIDVMGHNFLTLPDFVVGVLKIFRVSPRPEFMHTDEQQRRVDEKEDAAIRQWFRNMAEEDHKIMSRLDALEKRIGNLQKRTYPVEEQLKAAFGKVTEKMIQEDVLPWLRSAIPQHCAGLSLKVQRRDEMQRTAAAGQTQVQQGQVHLQSPPSPDSQQRKGFRLMESLREELLRAAYGDEWGKTGSSDLRQGRGSSLLYGVSMARISCEFAVPASVEQLARAFCTREEPLGGPVLELGMGTGKVALQLFFTLHVDIFGLELAPSRYVLAASALRELSRASERFTFQEPGDSSVLLDHDYGVRCEFRCASLLDTSVEMLQTASAVVMEVCLPLEVQREASKRLQMCQPGCRIVSYSALHGLVGQDCRLGPVKAESGLTGDGRGGISLAASWKPVGHGFGFYEMAASAEDAAAAWSQATAKLKSEDAVQVDVTGCPSRARRLRYTDDVLADPALAKYPWAKGDKVLVGYSWLPFPDLGEPDDGSAGGLDGVTWMPAYVVCVFEDNFVNVCYEDDGTVEERVHPDRIRIPGKRREVDAVT